MVVTLGVAVVEEVVAPVLQLYVFEVLPLANKLMFAPLQTTKLEVVILILGGVLTVKIDVVEFVHVLAAVQ